MSKSGARKARRRRLKIMKPMSPSPRKLLFNHALHLAQIDDRIDSRERSAADKPARQLQISQQSVERKRQSLRTPDATEVESRYSDDDISVLADSLSRDWVIEILDPDVYLHRRANRMTAPRLKVLPLR